MLAFWLLVAGGAALAALGFAWGRSGRLSMGHATVWLLLGLLLAGVGLLAALTARDHEPHPAAWFALSLLVLAFAATGIAHAAALTRLDQRVRGLAQEVALLNEARGRAGGGREADADR